MSSSRRPRRGPRRGAIRTLGVAQLTNSVGDGAFYVTSALFFTTVIGRSPAEVGLGLSAAWALGFVATTPLGHLADRWGLRQSAVTLSVLTAAGIVLLATAQSMTGFVLATSVYAVAQSGLGAVRQALVVSLVPEADRVRVRARLQAIVNAGIGLGAAVGGAALLTGTASAYLVVFALDAAAFLGAAGLLSRLPASGPTHRAPHAVTTVFRDRRYVMATALNAVLYLYMPVLSVLVPLWVAERTRAPHWVVAALFVLNTLGVVCLQGGAARRVTGLLSAGRSIAAGGALLAVASLMLWSAPLADDPASATAVLVAAGSVLVVGEVLVAAGSWEIGFGLADPARPGTWQGFFGSGIPAARAAGPSLLVLLVMDWPGPGWLILAAFFATAATALRHLARRAAGGDIDGVPVVGVAAGDGVEAIGVRRPQPD